MTCFSVWTWSDNLMAEEMERREGSEGGEKRKKEACGRNKEPVGCWRCVTSLCEKLVVHCCCCGD